MTTPQRLDRAAAARAAGVDLRSAERNGLVGAVIVVHLLALWGLMQVGAVQQTLRQTAPRMLAFISLPTPQPPRPSAPAQWPARVPPQAPAAAALPSSPPLVAAVPTATLATPAMDAPQPVAVPPPAAVAASTPAPALSAAPPAPPPPAPPQPQLLPASNIAYLLPPPIELPLASRRLGEQGLVHLRVRVGVDGLPREVSVQRSSGFARLDDQAVSAMKRARFKPQTERGVPIEWVVVAPLQYEIE